MLEKLLDNKLKVALITLLVALLVAVRAFEDQIFYDPFSAYFKNDYLDLAFPPYDGWTLLLSMVLRFLVNTIVSLMIIYVLFKDKNLVQFTAVLYVFLGIALLFAFFGLLHFSDSHNNFILFYVRRFLIQPLFLLVFVPAFYFQRLKSEL